MKKKLLLFSGEKWRFRQSGEMRTAIAFRSEPVNQAGCPGHNSDLCLSGANVLRVSSKVNNAKKPPAIAGILQLHKILHRLFTRIHLNYFSNIGEPNLARRLRILRLLDENTIARQEGEDVKTRCWKATENPVRKSLEPRVCMRCLP